MGTHPLIFIRTDGNHQIASGHLVRCLSIALACHGLGMEVRFLVSQGESLSLLEGLLEEHQCSFFQIISLKTAVFDQPQRELAEVSALLQAAALDGQLPAPGTEPATGSGGLPVYLLDSYYVTESYLSALRPLARIAYLDDLQLFDYSVDLLINYDVIPPKALPACRAACQNAGQLLLGARFAPLRPQFQNRTVPVRERVENILVTTGAGDPCHLCLTLARRFLPLLRDKQPMPPLPDCSGIQPAPTSASGLRHRQSLSCRVHMVIGKLNTDRDALCDLARQLPFLTLHENVTDMARLMQTCDLAVSAAGTTLYELCALGVPTMSFSMADNQIPSARAFDTVGAIPWAGDLRKNPREVMQSLMNFMTRMSETDSLSERTSAHKTMRRLIDGKGAYRIAQALDHL